MTRPITTEQGARLNNPITHAGLAVRLGPRTGIDVVGKRVLDLLGAALAIALLAPVMIAILLLIAIDDGRPFIFRQRRVGFAGREFTVLKFRSMVKNAESLKERLRDLNEVSDGPIFKLRQDPRVTRVGKFLRRYSLDELPQLFNVLRGEMSLVGPRPALASEVAEYEAWQFARLSVKPGLTGLWQVSGRSDLGFLDMVRLDIEYAESWSLWQDLCLLARTPAILVSTRGAY